MLAKISTGISHSLEACTTTVNAQQGNRCTNLQLIHLYAHIMINTIILSSVSWRGIDAFFL